MNSSEAYSIGRNHGHGIACHNVPSIGEKLWIAEMGRVTVTAENIREIHQCLCFEAESYSRQYSPFEFTAHEFNEAENSEELWDAYENGVTAAIFEDLSKYTDEDYRIPGE